MSLKSFNKFSVWLKARSLVLSIYKITDDFPGDERFGLVSNIKRAANSIAHNIAEGFGRYENRDKSRFYKISRGSAYEVISQCLVAENLGYLDPVKANKLISGYESVISELDKLIKTIENRGS